MTIRVDKYRLGGGLRGRNMVNIHIIH